MKEGRGPFTLLFWPQTERWATNREECRAPFTLRFWGQTEAFGCGHKPKGEGRPRSFHPSVLATNRKVKEGHGPFTPRFCPQTKQCRAALLYRSVVSNNMGFRTRAGPSHHCSGCLCLSFVLFRDFRPPCFLIWPVMFSDNIARPVCFLVSSSVPLDELAAGLAADGRAGSCRDLKAVSRWSHPMQIPATCVRPAWCLDTSHHRNCTPSTLSPSRCIHGHEMGAGKAKQRHSPTARREGKDRTPPHRETFLAWTGPDVWRGDKAARGSAVYIIIVLGMTPAVSYRHIHTVPYQRHTNAVRERAHQASGRRGALRPRDT